MGVLTRAGCCVGRCGKDDVERMCFKTTSRKDGPLLPRTHGQHAFCASSESAKIHALRVESVFKALPARPVERMVPCRRRHETVSSHESTDLWIIAGAQQTKSGDNDSLPENPLRLKNVTLDDLCRSCNGTSIVRDKFY